MKTLAEIETWVTNEINKHEQGTPLRYAVLVVLNALHNVSFLEELREKLQATHKSIYYGTMHCAAWRAIVCKQLEEVLEQLGE